MERYISSVFDCFDNACLGLSMGDNIEIRFGRKSLKLAISNIKINNNSIVTFHLNRGSQYTSADFKNLLF